MAEADVKNKKIFWRSSHPDVFCKKGPLKCLAKLTGKHMNRSHFLKKNSGCRPATVFKKRLMHRFFSAKFLRLFRTAFYSTTVNRCTISFDISLIIIYDLGKCLKILTIIDEFIENIWNFRVAMKQSENRI